jgi:hypothetical protein
MFCRLSKIWVWDPGSGKNLFRIPDPGVKKAPDPGSGSATLLEILSRRKNYRNARKDGEQTKAKKRKCQKNIKQIR